MKKYLFCGGYKDNVGPSNVNREYINNLPASFAIIKEGNKYLELIKTVFYVIRCKVVVASGVSGKSLRAAKLAKKFGKKLIYIMHGSYRFESEINQITPDEDGLGKERLMQESADLILAVSENYMNLMKGMMPEFASKFGYLTNGIYAPNINVENEGVERKEHSVVVIGGDVKVKNNKSVSDAVERMDGSAILYVYGPISDEDFLSENRHTKVVGKVERDELFSAIKKSDLFVLNSYMESFSMAAIEALSLGASVLLSKNVGALSILDTEDCDIINDNEDVNEIKEKMEYLLDNPNNERILKSIDFEANSFKAQGRKLELICEKLYNTV